jgi:hypothetical protein
MATFNWFIFFVEPTLLVLTSFERYVGITFVEEKMNFDILFSIPFGAYKISIKESK